MLFLASMIRPATEGDFDNILGLEALLFPDNSLSLARLEREAKASQIFVIGEPVHAYTIVGTDGTILDLLRLGVHPDQQGRGDGAKLLEHVIALGRDLTLTVRKKNHRAFRLYRRYGFTIAGHFISADSWVLFRPAGELACPVPQPCG